MSEIDLKAMETHFQNWKKDRAPQFEQLSIGLEVSNVLDDQKVIAKRNIECTRARTRLA